MNSTLLLAPMHLPELGSHIVEVDLTSGVNPHFFCAGICDVVRQDWLIRGLLTDLRQNQDACMLILLHSL